MRMWPWIVGAAAVAGVAIAVGIGTGGADDADVPMSGRYILGDGTTRGWTIDIIEGHDDGGDQWVFRLEPEEGGGTFSVSPPYATPKIAYDKMVKALWIRGGKVE